jgi:hypothetical protein
VIGLMHQGEDLTWVLGKDAEVQPEKDRKQH